MQLPSRRFALALTLALALPLAAAAQTQKPPAPSTAKPSTAKPSTTKPATAKPPAPEPAKPPAPPPPQDVRFKSIYTTGDMKTESVTYIKGARERFEFQDMVLLKQHDQKRTIQISKAANTYLVAPDGVPAAPSGAGRAGRCRPAAGRDHGHDHHRRHRRTEDGLRPAGPPREDDDRQAADAGRVRHVEAAHRDRRLVYRCAAALANRHGPDAEQRRRCAGRLRRPDPGDEQRRPEGARVSRSPTRRRSPATTASR